MRHAAAHFVRGQTSPVLEGCLTVGGETGSADTVRNPREFAVEFYTEQDNWDMVGESERHPRTPA